MDFPLEMVFFSQTCGFPHGIFRSTKITLLAIGAIDARIFLTSAHTGAAKLLKDDGWHYKVVPQFVS